MMLRRGNVEKNRAMIQAGIFLLLFVSLTGCQGVPEKEAVWRFHPAALEAEWIRNGEPVEFEGEKWYPADAFENLLDSEVYLVGEYRGVSVFVDMTDVRPYERLYTRFARNKYRFFEKRNESP